MVGQRRTHQKANGKWRLCIDFTDVNRACPKDSFPLPRINLIVDATVGHELLSFMDAFSDYNQISMDPDDQEKTSFVTGQGTYCYQVMPFGLKNTGATYQRLVNRMFQKQIGTSMEVYRRHVSKINYGRAPYNSSGQGIPDPEKVQYEVESSQMRFHSLSLKILGFYSQQPRNRGKPKQDKSCARHSAAIKHKRSPTPNRKNSCAKPFCVQGQR